jgi:hypothetical protein
MGETAAQSSMPSPLEVLDEPGEGASRCSTVWPARGARRGVERSRIDWAIGPD